MRLTDPVTANRRLVRRTRVAVLCAALLTLGACQTVTLSDLNPFGSDAPQPCPRSAALADAVSITEFGRGNSRDESNVIYTARIDGTAYDCQVIGDQVTGRLAIVGTLELGRKGKEGPLTLPIFIALAHSGTDVLSKRFDSVDVIVDRGETRAEFEKSIPDFTFSLAGDSNPLAYEVLTGFNLRPDQVEYNRSTL